MPTSKPPKPDPNQELNGRHTEIRFLRRGNHHDWQSRDLGQRAIDRLEPATVGQIEIQQHGVEARLGQMRDRLRERPAPLHLDRGPGCRERFTEHCRTGLVVFDEQHADGVVFV